MSRLEWDDLHAPCPNRGVGLSHTNKDGRCRECGITLMDRRRPEPPIPEVTQVEPPLDVASRLRDMGLIPDYKLSPDCIVDHDSLTHGVECGTCGVVHEDRFPPQGCKGPTHERGRGDLSPRDIGHLLFIKTWPSYTDR